jgi:hypothetical protein
MFACLAFCLVLPLGYYETGAVVPSDVFPKCENLSTVSKTEMGETSAHILMISKTSLFLTQWRSRLNKHTRICIK